MTKRQYLVELVKRDPSFAVALRGYDLLHAPVQSAPVWLYLGKDANGKPVYEVAQ
jgi:hypothetical protein